MSFPQHLFRPRAMERPWRTVAVGAAATLTFAVHSAQAQSVPAGYTITPFVTSLSAGTPTQLTADPVSGTLYYATASSSLFSIAPNRTVSTVSSNFTPGSGNPYGWTDIEFTGGSVYIASNSKLIQTNTTTGVVTTLSSALTGFGNECGEATVGNLLYITSGNNTTKKLDTFDLTTNTLTTVNATLPNNASTLQYDPVANKLYFACLNNGAYYQYDPTINTYVQIATETSSNNGNFAVSPSGQDIYVRTSGGVDQIDIATGAITPFVTGLSGGAFGSDVTFGPSSSGVGQSLYVAGSSSVYEVTGFGSPTTTSLVSSGSPSVFGQPVTFTATVAGGDGGGTVQFTVDGVNSGSPVALSGGTAAYTPSSIGVGSHSVTAVYSGDALSAASTSAIVTQVVGQAGTATVVTASPSPATDDQPITLTATVTASAPGAGTPTGTVQFTVDGVNSGSPVALSGGTATYAAGALLPGNHAVSATYSGDVDFTSGTPGQTTANVVAGAATHFTISAPGTATAGSAFSLTVTALDAHEQTATGYAGTLHLSSTDAQAVLPVDASLTGGVGQFTVTLQTAGTQTVSLTDTVTPSLTVTSGSITVSPASAGQIAFVQQPTDVVTGAPVVPPPAVKISDPFGNPVAGTNVTVSLLAGSGTLAGTVSQTTDANGVATFPGLSLSRPGQKTLQAASGTNLTAASSPFTVSADDALTAQGHDFAATKRVGFSVSVATFTDTDTASPVSDFQATIDWGDGSGPTPGTVSAADGAFSVTGSHSYTTDGIYTVKTTIADTQPGGPTVTAQSKGTVTDITTPATVATLNPSAPNGQNGYYTAPVTVTLAASDPDDTSSEITTFYTVDGGDQTSYEKPFIVSGDAAHTVSFFSVDKAGNAETAQTVAFNIDASAPVTSGTSQSGTAGVQVSLSATDDFSGVAATVYSVDGGGVQSYTGPFSVPNTGSHTITFHSTDGAGNSEAPQTLTVTSAPTAPAVLHTFPAGLQLFSVPKDFSGIALGTALSQINPRLSLWDPTLLQYTFATEMRPGLGYWTRFGGVTSLYNLGTPTPTDKPFTITLKRGWNMIGDPFPGGVSLSSVQVRSADGKAYSFPAANTAALVGSTLYSYPAGSTQYQTQGQDGSLAPYMGYWLYAFQGCTLEVPAP